MRVSHITACGLAVYLATLAPSYAQVVQAAPALGHPGITVALTGTGFGDSEAVDVYVDTTDVLLTVSSLTGAVNAPVTIPASEQPGTHFLTAIGRHSGDAAQVAFNVTTAWNEQGFGAARLAWNPYENTISGANVATLGELWSSPTNSSGSTPILANGKVYVTTYSGIQALSPATGAVLWNKLPGEVFYGSPAVVGSYLYAIGENSSTFYALNAVNGATRWTQTFGAGSFSSPTVVHGVVYIASLDSKIYALNATTGAILWSTVVGSPGEASPAVVDGVVYVGSSSSIYALNASTGAINWSYSTGDIVEGSPAVANGVLYEGSDDGVVHALRTASPAGTTSWSYGTGGAVYGAPAVAGGTVYIGSADGHMYAFNAHTGSVRWTFATPSIPSSAVVANNVAYFTSRDGTLFALDAGTGAMLASADTGYAYLGNPVVSDGVLYVNANGGNTYAYDLLGGVNARKAKAIPPSFSSLHPNRSLRVTR